MDTHAWINTVGVLLTLTVTIYLATRGSMRRNEREIAEIKVKVETMWNFLLKRGVAEGVNNGMLTMNSPVRLTAESAQVMEHLAGELQEFRNTKFPDADEKTLALRIEEEFGDRLVKEVCVPNNISYGVCLLIATAVAKGGHTLTEILDEYEVPRREPEIET
jgi:hypothetical protein